MATALKLNPHPACDHLAFNPYETVGGGLDDMTVELGRCPSCDCWLEITTYIASGYSEERALDASEIMRLRREALL